MRFETIGRIVISASFILSGMMKGVNLQAVGQTVSDYCGLFSLAPDYIIVSITAFFICGTEIWLGLLATDKATYRRLQPIYIIIMTGFTFLTYVNLTSPFGNFGSCGCFGEIVPINATETFIKNIVLLGIMISLAIAIRPDSPKQLYTATMSPGFIYMTGIASLLPITVSQIFLANLSATAYVAIYILVCVTSVLTSLICIKPEFSYRIKRILSH